MKEALKSVVRALALLAVLPLALLEWGARGLLRRDVLFEGQSQLLSLVPGALGVYLRVAWCRLLLRHCAPDACIEFGTVFSRSSAEVKARAYIGLRCSIGSATIGAYTMLADGVYLLSGGQQHATGGGRSFQEQEKTFLHITIGPNCWLGTAAVIMADVGEGSVIGAASVVTKPVPAGVIAVGAPARVIREAAVPAASSAGS